MHIKYRPKTIDEVIGNDAIKLSIKNLPYDRPILFEGERGSGKTTIASIIANTFADSENNIKEYNCGVNTGIDSIRSVLEELQRSSIFGRRKALILDEIHLLSDPAKQALLKVLEEETLPDRSIILACTTEPTKLPIPLYERFLNFRVQPLSNSDALKLINYICEKETIVLKKQVKVLLIEKSEGIPRRVLTGLAKIRGIEDWEQIQYLLELNSIDENEDILFLFKVILTNDWDKIKAALPKVLKKNKPETIRCGLMNLLSGRAISQYYRMEDNKQTVKLYRSLQAGAGFPEKANLILSIMEGVCQN